MNNHKKLRYYLESEVAKHNLENDCWVSVFGKVLDLTTLLANNAGVLAQPIIRSAGEDVSHWFDPDTQEPKTHVDVVSGMKVPYLPHGRYIHVPPNDPTTTWNCDFAAPWWKDDQYCIGLLSKKKRLVKVVNTLTSQEDVLEVCCEETLADIKQRYRSYNDKIDSYTWKRMGRPLNMNLNLEDNDIPDETSQFQQLGLSPDTYIPAIHIYFNMQV